MNLRRPQVLALAAASVLGLLAFFVMKGMTNRPPPPPPAVAKKEGTQVLVIREDVQLGQPVTEAKLAWQDWPATAVAPTWITHEARPNALQEFTGFIARTSLAAGEPLIAQKLVHLGSGGILAAVVRPGKRAVSTKISESTAAGKMILPGDYVDVFVSRRGKSGDAQGQSLMRNVRVLAIGQNVDVANGKKSADGNVATLEVTVGQATRLSAATVGGEIWLALRSLADSGPSAQGDERPEADIGLVKFFKYGVPSQAHPSIN